MSSITPDLNNRFEYHAPDEKKKLDHESIRWDCMQLAHTLDVLLPDGREKALAITKLEEVMFWSNAAIARHQ